MKLKIKNEFISTIIGTISIYIGLAFLLPLGNFSVYITSYINLKDSYVTMHYGLFINLIFTFAHSFSSPLGGYFENLLGFFQTIIVGFSIIFLSNLAFIFQQNIWLCYTLTLILGIGVGIGASLIGKNITFFVPNKKGLVVGIFGLSVTIIVGVFGFVGEKIINFEGYTLKEDEEFYPKNIAERIYLYFLAGECCLPLGLFFALLLIYEFKPEYNKEENPNPNEENKEEKLISDSSMSRSNEADLNNNQENQITEEIDNKTDLKNDNSKNKIKQVIKTFRYWRITFILFFMNFAISFMISTGRTFGALIGINGTALQYAGILQSFVSVIGPFLGIIVDKKGPLIILRIFSILSIFPPVLLIFFMENDFIFIFCFVICIINIQGIVISFNPFIMEVYGIQESVILGGIMSGLSKLGDIISTVSAFVFSLICKNEEDEIIIDKRCLKEKYAIMYLISGVCGCLSSLLLFFESKDKFIYKDDPNEEMKKNNDEDKTNNN